MIDLAEYGLPTYALNMLKPTIIITEYYNNRADCACSYGFRTCLEEPKMFVLILSFNEHLFRSLRRDHLDNTNSTFLETEPNILQWQQSWWRKAEHVYKKYDDGKSVIQVETTGTDRQFWAGRFCLEFNNNNLFLFRALWSEDSGH
jgi:hypothetical protein